MALNADEGTGSQPEVDDAWRDEIASRIDDIVNNRVELISFEQTREKARALPSDL